MIHLNLNNIQYLFPSFWDLLNGSIFISGGLTEADDIDPVGNAYSIEGYQSKITHAESMITPRYKHELAFWNKCVYAIGGFTKNRVITKNVEKFDFYSGEWERLPQMFYERADFTALPSQSSKTIYVFGGWVAQENNTIIEKFDWRSEVWVILKIKLNFAINKFHHLWTIKEGLPIPEESNDQLINENKQKANGTLDDINPMELLSENEKENKSVNSERPASISAAVNPQDNTSINPAELLYEKVLNLVRSK